MQEGTENFQGQFKNYRNSEVDGDIVWVTRKVSAHKEWPYLCGLIDGDKFRKSTSHPNLKLKTIAGQYLDQVLVGTGQNYFGQQIAGAVVQALGDTGAAQAVQKVPGTDCTSLNADLNNAGVCIRC
ncbi:hypothetical protein R6Q59_016572 [Mikania micrantha]